MDPDDPDSDPDPQHCLKATILLCILLQVIKDSFYINTCLHLDIRNKRNHRIGYVVILVSSLSNLKVPKREIFLTELIILSYPISTGDLGTTAKN